MQFVRAFAVVDNQHCACCHYASMLLLLRSSRWPAGPAKVLICVDTSLVSSEVTCHLVSCCASWDIWPCVVSLRLNWQTTLWWRQLIYLLSSLCFVFFPNLLLHLLLSAHTVCSSWLCKKFGRWIPGMSPGWALSASAGRNFTRILETWQLGTRSVHLVTKCGGPICWPR